MDKRIVAWLVFLFFVFFLYARGKTEANVFDYISIEAPHGDAGFVVKEYFWGSGNEKSKFEIKYRIFEEELNLRTKIVAYDPRFIDISLGGGITFGQGQIDYDGGSNQLTKFNISADILKEKPYHGRIYFTKDNIDFEQSPSATYLLKQTNIGSTFRLAEHTFGIPIPIDITFRSSDRGSKNTYDVTTNQMAVNDFYRINDSTKTIEVETKKKLAKTDLYLKLYETATEKMYATKGSQTNVEYMQMGVYANANGKSGDHDQFRWKNKFSWLAQTDFPQYSLIDSGGELRYKIFDEHASAIDAVFTSSMSERKRQARDGTSQNYDSLRFKAGFDHRLFRSLFSEFRLLYDGSSYAEYDKTSMGMLLGTRYTKKIPGGNVYSQYSFLARKEDNTGNEISFSANEMHVISDYAPITFDAENINIASIVVTNQSRTVVYLPGTDYRLYQIGRQIQIERVPGSTIVNGDTVLVDYFFLSPRGSFTEMTHNFSLGIKWRFVEPYLNIQERVQNLISGNDRLLNPGESVRYGVKLRERLYEMFTPEVSIEHEENTFFINPFTRTTVGGSLAFARQNTPETILYVKHSATEYHKTDYDTDYSIAGIDISYLVRRGKVSVGLSKELSDIGTSKRDTLMLRAGASYGYGQWLFDASFRTATETLGDTKYSLGEYERNNSSFIFTIKRTF